MLGWAITILQDSRTDSRWRNKGLASMIWCVYFWQEICNHDVSYVELWQGCLVGIPLS